MTSYDGTVEFCLTFEHLPEHLQAVSRVYSVAAVTLSEGAPLCEDDVGGMRHLVLATDCAVRAVRAAVWRSKQPKE